MKKLLPIIAVLTLVSTGCIREGTEGCPACMDLVFTYGGAAAGFDKTVGNDVRLQVYYDGVWYSTRTIPYEQIAGGRKYPFKKSNLSQRLQLLAYAVPAGCDDGNIPAAYEGLAFTAQGVSMKEVSRSLPLCSPDTDDMYTGVLDITEPPGQYSSHIVDMKDVFCRVDVVIENADLFHTRFPGAGPLTGLSGVARGVTSCDGAPSGGGVEVISPMTSDGANNRISTSVMRVMPSPDGQTTLSANIYDSAQQPLLPVYETGELAAAGRDITIIYRMEDASVTITLVVEGWKVRTQTVPLD